MVFYDWTYIILGVVLIPGIILGIIAQSKVNNAYSKYSKVFCIQDIKANVMARKILDAAELSDVSVVKINGKLTDHYNKRDKILALSEEVYDSSSIAALGIAAHELGHALQDKDNYLALKLRGIFGVIAKIGNFTLWPLIVLGIVFSALPLSTNTTLGTVLIVIGLSLFGFSTLFSLITLPVEINASKRTELILVKTKLLTNEEYEGVKKVLRAAALTYVADLVNSILSFIRILLYISIKTKKD